jgi:hypothetical protein
VPKKTGRSPQRDKPPCGSGSENESQQEDAPSRNSGTMHEKHLQAGHDPPCKSVTVKRNRQKELGHGQRTERDRDRTDVREETSAATEMQRGHEKTRCRGTATQLRIAEKLEFVKVSAPSGTTNHGLDTVEVSAPSKTKKRKTARVGGTGNTEAPASPKRVN